MTAYNVLGLVFDDSGDHVVGFSQSKHSLPYGPIVTTGRPAWPQSGMGAPPSWNASSSHPWPKEWEIPSMAMVRVCFEQTELVIPCAEWVLLGFVEGDWDALHESDIVFGDGVLPDTLARQSSQGNTNQTLPSLTFVFGCVWDMPSPSSSRSSKPNAQALGIAMLSKTMPRAVRQLLHSMHTSKTVQSA